MRYFYDYGEGLLCFVPVFFVIAAVAFALIWNNLPDRSKKKRLNDERPPE